MTVLDAQAIVALLVGESAAQEVADVIRAEPGASISASNVAEVVSVLVRIMGHKADAVGERLDWLVAGGLRVVAVDDALGRLAGRIHAERYDRRDAPISMADCVALATALTLGEPLATSDPPLASIARTFECVVLPLPDSHGQRPS